ncbi:MAG: hypothetical protein AAB470_00280 [Patescibacteria group bacterium]
MFKILKIYKSCRRRRIYGFIATTAIILLSTGSLAFLVATSSAVFMYADSIEKREIRIQNNLNQQACQDTLRIMNAKDYFLNVDIQLSDFGCIAR